LKGARTARARAACLESLRRRTARDLQHNFVDYSGYRFRLDKLNHFGDFRSTELVRAFISSDEYRKRFDQ
jgi:hypothetical protein